MLAVAQRCVLIPGEKTKEATPAAPADAAPNSASQDRATNDAEYTNTVERISPILFL